MSSASCKRVVEFQGAVRVVKEFKTDFQGAVRVVKELWTSREQ